MELDPWDITNFDQFLFYNCPECHYKCKLAIKIKIHAEKNHGVRFDSSVVYSKVDTLVHETFCTQSNEIKVIQDSVKSQQPSNNNLESISPNSIVNPTSSNDIVESESFSDIVELIVEDSEKSHESKGEVGRRISSDITDYSDNVEVDNFEEGEIKVSQTPMEIESLGKSNAVKKTEVNLDILGKLDWDFVADQVNNRNNAIDTTNDAITTDLVYFTFFFILQYHI